MNNQNDEAAPEPAVTPQDTFSVAQLCRRWQVGEDRVHAMIRAGKLAAFALPSAVRFGRKLRVTLAAVLAAEEAWVVLPVRDVDRPPRPGAPVRTKCLQLPYGQSSADAPR